MSNRKYTYGIIIHGLSVYGLCRHSFSQWLKARAVFVCFDVTVDVVVVVVVFFYCSRLVMKVNDVLLCNRQPSKSINNYKIYI